MTTTDTPVYDWLQAQPRYRQAKQQPRHRRATWWQRLLKAVTR